MRYEGDIVSIGELFRRVDSTKWYKISKNWLINEWNRMEPPYYDLGEIELPTPLPREVYVPERNGSIHIQPRINI